MGKKTQIQRLPYVSSSIFPTIRYRIIFPQGYSNIIADYRGLEPDLPYWMHVKNEIANTLRALSK
ncbi:MAG: hypothetical protein K6F33_01940 [Bacteroidales bacterium]|nr:hypothetical protein [Bacteroidales bacterium]